MVSGSGEQGRALSRPPVFNPPMARLGRESKRSAQHHGDQFHSSFNAKLAVDRLVVIAYGMDTEAQVCTICLLGSSFLTCDVKSMKYLEA